MSAGEIIDLSIIALLTLMVWMILGSALDAERNRAQKVQRATMLLLIFAVMISALAQLRCSFEFEVRLERVERAKPTQQ
jgi:hypothetical protein